MDEKTIEILDIFQQINAIPRCSKHEEKISQWLKQWADDNGFKVRNDNAGNMVIKVPATIGYENTPGIVIQGHMDMVCEKTSDSDHDFSKDPIRFIYEGEWLKADKTSLGADNGIAIALGLALAKDKTVAHPPLELLFTVDEETGLTGANLLEPGFIKGNILLNIDSEDEGVFTVGCAGGKDTRITLPLKFSKISKNNEIYKLMGYGMRGGHSGIDIHKQRANANNILARTLNIANKSSEIRLISIKGGTAHNAIPRDAEAFVACDPSQFSSLQKIIEEFEQTVKKEYASTEISLAISLIQADTHAFDRSALTREDTSKVINLLLALPHGVARMSANMEGVVETSNNLATIEIKDKSLIVHTSQRSSVMSRLDEITSKIEAIAALSGANTKSVNEYPAWQPDMTSPLLKRCKKIYKNLFNKNPVVKTIHAGLECGVIGSKYQDMDMISLGPTIENPHSPDEKLYIPSISKVRDFLVALLKSYAQ